jgi:replicative DNA helicase
MDQKGRATGIATGFVGYDNLTSGLHRTDLTIVAARPGVGKSTLLQNIAKNAAVNQKIPTVFFSLEMGRQQLAQRFLCADADISLFNLMHGYINDNDWTAIMQSIGPLSSAPLYIDDTPALSMVELRSRARRMKMEFGLGLIVVDYLQLLTIGPGSRSESRQQEVSFISRSLKALAKELDLPVIVASQLSRAVETRKSTDNRPMLSDLLDSGGIEANADLVVFIYRDDYYDKNSAKKNIAELILAKHRNGPTGMVELYFLSQYNKFANITRTQ